MMPEGPVQWQPIEMLDVIATMIEGGALETRELRRDLQEAKPGSLDRATIERTKRLSNERLEWIGLYREQLARWRRLSPRHMQMKKIEEAARFLDEDEKLSREILEMCAGFVAIEEIAGMSDLELGLRVLGGAIPPPDPKTGGQPR